MDVKVLAIYLLIGHMISAVFMLMVLVRQAGLFRKRVPIKLLRFRKILFALALAIFAGNLNPILVDALTILGTVTRSTDRINVVGISYTASNALISALSALLIWTLYRLAAGTVLIVDEKGSHS